MERVHIAGIAGVGMSALAELLLAKGWQVSGSDRFLDQGRRLPVLGRLQALGATLFPQDGSGITPDTAALVYSTAVEENTPDIQAARKAGIPLKHRAELLAEIVEKSGAPLLAVAGTSGKTTITGMLGHALTALGAAPTVVNGGALIDWAESGGTGAVRIGRGGAPWVLEADESDRSFLRFHPDWAIISNLSQDHFSMAETLDLFRTFAGQVRCGLVCGTGVAELLCGVSAGKKVVTPEGTIETDAPDSCRIHWRGVDIHMHQGGMHTGWNALLAAELCHQLGYPPTGIAAALETFRGIQRRMECAGQSGGIRVYDDYAHNPAKIAAAWQTAALGGGRVLGVWRPHGYGPLRQGLDAFAAMFTEVMKSEDRLWLLPVFDAGGSAKRDVHSEDLAAKIPFPVSTPPGFPQMEKEILEAARPGDVILLMGARDPELPLSARRLATDLPMLGKK